jgi:hypothetical protein
LEPIVCNRTNLEIDEKIKFDRMLHSMDENKKSQPFDEKIYPKLDWYENKYELFAIIYEADPGHYVSYVLKEDGK